MDTPFASDLRRPLPLAFLGLAAIGWVLAIWSLADARSDAARSADDIAALRRQNEQVTGDLKAARAASGALADVEARRAAVLAEIATAQTNLRVAEKARDEAQARVKSTDDTVQQLTAQQSGLQQAVSKDTADLNKVRADLEEAIRRDGAIKLDSAQADNDLSAGKAQLQNVLVLKAAAEKAVADAKEQASALARDITAKQSDLADMQRQADAARSAVEAAQAALPPLQAQKAALEQALQIDEAARARLVSDTATLSAEAKTATATLEALQAKADKLEGSVDDATQRIAAAQAALDGITALVATKTAELKQTQDAIEAAKAAPHTLAP